MTGLPFWGLVHTSITQEVENEGSVELPGDSVGWGSGVLTAVVQAQSLTWELLQAAGTTKKKIQIKNKSVGPRRKELGGNRPAPNCQAQSWAYLHFTGTSVWWVCGSKSSTGLPRNTDSWVSSPTCWVRIPVGSAWASVFLKGFFAAWWFVCISESGEANSSQCRGKENYNSGERFFNTIDMDHLSFPLKFPALQITG